MKWLKQGTQIGIGRSSAVIDAMKLSARNVVVASLVRVILLRFTQQIERDKLHYNRSFIR